MQRLAGPKNVPKAPSGEKKTEPMRVNSQNRGGSTSASKGIPQNKGGSLTKPSVGTGAKKDSAKELLLRMK